MILTKFLRILITASCAAIVPMAAFAAKTNPSIAHTVQPTYPAELLKAGVEGKAVVQATVTEKGDVGAVELISADDPAFGTAAVDAVKQWTFTPGTDDGKPTAKTVRFPIVFNLPADRKFNIRAGRDVFTAISEPIISEDKLDHPLKVVAAPVAYWPAGLDGDPSQSQIGVRLVVSPTGTTLNPELSEDTPEPLILPVLDAVAKMTFEAPVYKGKPTYALGEAIVLFVDAPPPPKAP